MLIQADQPLTQPLWGTVGVVDSAKKHRKSVQRRKKRDRQTETETDRDRETDRQTDRQTCKHWTTQTDSVTGAEREKNRHGFVEKKTEGKLM